MGQVWNGSQWVNRAGAPKKSRAKKEPETDAEDVTETSAETSDAENGEEEAAET